MTVRPRLPRAARLAAYRAFYRLPIDWRQRLVRLGTPGYTMGSVVIVRADGDGGTDRLLLLRQPPGRGWSLPGGLLGRGERPVDAAARELEEETGVSVTADDLRPGVPNAVVHTRGRWVDMVFEVRVPLDIEFDVDEAEVHEAAWHRVDELPRLTGPTAKLLAHYGLGPFADRPEDD